MRIQQLKDVTQLSVPIIKDLRKRGHLPFEGPATGTTDAAGRTWSHFDIWDAMRLIAAQRLVWAGLGWPDAAAVLRARPTSVSEDRFLLWNGGQFRARAEFRNVRGDEPFLGDRFRVYEGDLSDIVRSAVGYADAHNRGVRFDRDAIVLSSLVSVNLSEALTLAKARADVLGISYSDDNGLSVEASE